MAAAMKRLPCATIILCFPLFALFPLLLTGCGDESDSFPADGRDFDAEGYIAGTAYTGRVIDGYLKNARVWLDIDGDGQVIARVGGKDTVKTMDTIIIDVTGT